MGGKGWEFWRELPLSEGTAISSRLDYKLRYQAWPLAQATSGGQKISETSRGFDGWSGILERLKTNTAHGLEILVLNIQDVCRNQDCLGKLAKVLAWKVVKKKKKITCALSKLKERQLIRHSDQIPKEHTICIQLAKDHMGLMKTTMQLQIWNWMYRFVRDAITRKLLSAG